MEVDLHYPQRLHDAHNEYPLAPKRLLIDKVKKLVPNLRDKNRYVLHYKALKFYLEQGKELTGIYRGIKFTESPWLKEYIDFNTSKRAAATNEFEKDFFKLMNLAIFGKTMGNVRNRIDMKLISNEKQANKLLAKPNYESRTIFDDNLVAVHMKRT